MGQWMRKSLVIATIGAALLTTSAMATAGPTLLVGNKGEDTLSFIDLESGKELARRPTGKWPHEIAISPDNRQAAVVSYGGTTVELFDIAKREKIRTIELAPNAGPHGIVWLRDNRLVVTTERSRSVAIADPAAGRLTASIPTDQAGTHMVAVTRNGRTAFTANIPAGTVTVLDLAGNKKLRDLPVGGKPEGIALSVDEKLLWVADLEGARVQAFDARTFERKAEIATGKGPIRVAASPDGRWIVTSNVGSGNLTLIDARRLRKVRDIPISGTQEAGQVTILFGPGGRLYIAETGRDQVAEVVLPSGKVLRRIKSGKNGDGLAIAR
jgi:YVTN family beta-propeller protein